MKVRLPILLAPGGEADAEDVEAVSQSRLILQDWIETRYQPGLLFYFLRPVSPRCEDPWSYCTPDADIHQGPRPWVQVKEWLSKRTAYSVEALSGLYGVGTKDIIYLVFLKDLHNPLEGHPEEYTT